VPRFRFDQLMRLAWQGMVPVGVVMVIGVAALTAFGLQTRWYAALPLNVVMVALMLFQMSRSKVPVTGRQGDLPEVEVRPT
jgi:hypothetical protein